MSRSSRGQGRRRDDNEPDVVKALRDVGASVFHLYETGMPDLLVGYHGATHLLEVKRPLGPRGGLPEHREHEGGLGDMTEDQVKWWAAWDGAKPILVRTAEEALIAIGAM